MDLLPKTCSLLSAKASRGLADCSGKPMLARITPTSWCSLNERANNVGVAWPIDLRYRRMKTVHLSGPLTTNNSRYFREEFLEGSNLDDRGKSIGQFPIANRHVEIVDALHLRQVRLIRKPLIGDANLHDFMGTRIKFRLREQNHDSFIPRNPIGCIQQSLMCPSLNNTLAG